MACTSVLFLFTLFYGYLQELVSIHIFAREFGLFVTFLQFCGYAFFAFLQWISREHKRNNVPMQYCIALSVLQSSMQGLSNLSMRYLNYPAKVLFKSSRVLPTMLFGVVIYGESYCALHLPLSVSSLQPRHLETCVLHYVQEKGMHSENILQFLFLFLGLWSLWSQMLVNPPISILLVLRSS